MLWSNEALGTLSVNGALGALGVEGALGALGISGCLMCRRGGALGVNRVLGYLEVKWAFMPGVTWYLVPLKSTGRRCLWC